MRARAVSRQPQAARPRTREAGISLHRVANRWSLALLVACVLPIAACGDGRHTGSAGGSGGPAPVGAPDGTAEAPASDRASTPGPGAPHSVGPIQVTDPAGHSVAMDRPARRVVSMVPAMTEWIVAFGSGDRLVARTDYDAEPSLSGLPSVGGGLDPSVEWLAARHPDLVIAWPDAPSRSLVARLEGLGIPVYTAAVQTVEGAFGAARDLGRLLGEDSAAAAVVDRVRAGLDAVHRGTAGAPRPSALFVIGLDPLMAAGPGTFLDQLLEEAGATNVLADVSVLWPQLSLEEIVARSPDVVILATAGEAAASRQSASPDKAASAPGSSSSRDGASAARSHATDLLRGRPGWREIPAVRDGRVYAVDPYVVNRPGPQLAESARLLARLVHGRDQ